MSLVIFDLDGTLLSCNISFEFSKFLYKKGDISLLKLLSLIGINLAHRGGLASTEDIHRLAFQFILENRPPELIQSRIERFLEAELPALFRPELLERLQAAKEAKAEIWLMSSSPECIVRPIASFLGIDKAIGTTYSVQNGLYSAIDAIITGAEKRAYLDTHLRARARTTTAYSDSIQDLALLEGVDQPVAVFADSRLKKVARTRGWPQIK